VKSIGPALDAVIMHALAPNPAARPATAQGLRDMLSNAVPFAEALEEEQVADLLAAMLGDDPGPFRLRLPSMILRSLEAEGSSWAERRLRAEDSGIVEALTNPGLPVEDVGIRFESEMPPADDDTQQTGTGSLDEDSDFLTDDPTAVATDDVLRQVRAEREVYQSSHPPPSPITSDQPTAIATDELVAEARREEATKPSIKSDMDSDQPTAMLSDDLLQEARAPVGLDTSDSTEMLSGTDLNDLRVDDDLPEEATEMLSPETIAAIKAEAAGDVPLDAPDWLRNGLVADDVTDPLNDVVRQQFQQGMDLELVRSEMQRSSDRPSNFPEPPLSTATSKPPPPPMLALGMSTKTLVLLVAALVLLSVLAAWLF
jgi:hypothetical protein